MPQSAKTLGRRIALALFYALVGAICAAATIQVAAQVFTEGPRSPYPSCDDGLRALVAALERARSAAAEGSGPSQENEGEDAALARFRSALEPEWRYRDGIAAACRESETSEQALDVIERLRYAEEHAVRREAGDLAPLRRKVRALVPAGSAPPRPPAGAREGASAAPPD
jgi:hypothetical protein